MLGSIWNDKKGRREHSTEWRSSKAEILSSPDDLLCDVNVGGGIILVSDILDYRKG
jgi:hypothetical protein